MSHNYGVTAAKAFHMPTFRNITVLVWSLSFTQSGCGPKGQVPRVIHHPLNLQARSGKEPAGQSATHPSRTRPGLPMRCHIEVRIKDSFCISCDEGGLDMERCYTFPGHFNEAQSCVHSAEHIKCLNVTPPFALNIALKGSLEKSLMKNTRLWQESLRSIAKPGLSVELQNALEDGLELTGELVRILVRSRKDSGWVDQKYSQLPPALKTAIEQLQQDKEAGQLKLMQVLQLSRAILEYGGTPASVLPYWEALSVEGLEEPGE